RLVHREFSIRKLDEKALFDGCDVTPEGLWQISKLDPRDFLRLLDNARRIVGEVPLGTLISSRNRLATLGMMGTAMMSAPTLGDGVQAMSSFSTLEADYLHFQLSPGPLSTRIALETDRDLGSSLLLHAETVFLLLQDYLLDLVGNAAGRIHFRVADNAPPHSGALEAVLE
ncbi:MAG: AraC family transcriptional regulator ligand-binding domain-containing protein, partial [Luminiphilus sp.]